MDYIFFPNQRKWISPRVNIGSCMDEMKRLVKQQKENLVVIEPTLKLTEGPHGECDPEGEEPSENQYESSLLNSEAMSIGEYSSVIEAESERLAEEIEEKNRNKWSEDDATCAAAVAFVGGNDFFLFGKKASTKKGRKGKKDKDPVVKGQGRRGRKPKKVEVIDLEGDSDDEEAEGVVNEEIMERDEKKADESNRQNSTADNSQFVRKKTTAGVVNQYEKYNYLDSKIEDDDDEFDLDKELQEMPTIDEQMEEKLMREVLVLPGPLYTESDEDEADLLEFDNYRDNFAGLAHKLEDSKDKEDVGSGTSDESDKEDDSAKNIVDSSDEEIQQEENEQDVEVVMKSALEMEPGLDGDGTPDDGQVPCCSKSVPPPAIIPEPVPSTSSGPIKSSLAKGKKKQKKHVTLNLADTQQEKLASDPSVVSSQSEKEKTKSGGEQQKAKKNVVPVLTLPDPVEDFHRFTDWVFKQNNRRDKESRSNSRPSLMKKLNMTEDVVRRYQSFTSANMSAVRGEVFQDEPIMKSSSMPLLAPPTNLQSRTTLQSLAIFLTHGDDPSVFPWKSINVQQQMNDDYCNHEFNKRMEQQKRDITNPNMKNLLVNKAEDFLIQILIYQNADPDDALSDEVKLYIEPKLAYELHMLGSQTVKDLMNAFHCENDYVCLKDVPHPDNYKEDPTQFAKAQFMKSMILINDTVYTDPNSDSDCDYVTMINEWAAKPPEKNIGPFKRGDWSKKLRDLDLNFGFPYVYIHLGGCEHIYVFTKSRLLHTEDEHLIGNYPKINGVTRFKNVYCRVDNEYLARWAVLDFKEFPENPMLLCTECVHMYCYDKQKKKRGDFRLYPFTQLANIL